MAVELNHTIVATRNRKAASQWLAGILGLDPPVPFGPFMTVQLTNGVTLDFVDSAEDVRSQHYAFLVGDDDFDAIFDRLQALNVTYYADPGHRQPGEVNTRDAGRGLYFADADGHNLEILTRPYGSGPDA